MLAPNAKLRREVIKSAGPAGATLQVLREPQDKMGLGEDRDPADNKPAGIFGGVAARCWADYGQDILLLNSTLKDKTATVELKETFGVIADGAKEDREKIEVGEPILANNENWLPGWHAKHEFLLRILAGPHHNPCFKIQPFRDVGK